MSTPLEKLNFEICLEHLNTGFRVQDGTAGAIQLQLVNVVEGTTSPKIELFSLYFRGPFTPRLAQQTHPLEHDKLGVLEMFLTPIEADQENGTLYEAVFHRFRKS